MIDLTLQVNIQVAGAKPQDFVSNYNSSFGFYTFSAFLLRGFSFSINGKHPEQVNNSALLPVHSLNSSFNCLSLALPFLHKGHVWRSACSLFLRATPTVVCLWTTALGFGRYLKRWITRNVAMPHLLSSVSIDFTSSFCRLLNAALNYNFCNFFPLPFTCTVDII